ncbi:MAG: hypothetical protein CUN55_16220, partial [Phototrophicales bacterium]
MRFFFALFMAVFVVVTPHVVHAQGHSLYCSRAQSTAEIQKCLTRHVDSAQNRLNVIYTKLTTAMNGDALRALKKLQAQWLDYRDSECSWEKS